MMKSISSACAAILLAGVSSAAMADYQDYKCHVMSNKKGEQVVFYRWKISESKLRAASLPGKQLTDHNGKKYFIKDAFECVSLKEDFVGEDARKLDKRTLR